MSVSSRIALEKALGIAIALMGFELIARSVFGFSPAAAIFGRLLN